MHYLPFRLPTTLLSLAFPSVLWQGTPADGQKVVYLTLDDGPHPQATPFVLEQLEQRNMQATFFCTGKAVETYPSLAQVVANNYQVEMHGFHHLNSWKVPTKTYLTDVAKCRSTFETLLGKSPSLFRPPYGKLSPRAFFALRKHYQITLWSVMSHDYNPSLSVKWILEKIKRATFSGAIVVFHENTKAFFNLQTVLPNYLDFLSKKGYQTKLLKTICSPEQLRE